MNKRKLTLFVLIILCSVSVYPQQAEKGNTSSINTYLLLDPARILENSSSITTNSNRSFVVMRLTGSDLLTKASVLGASMEILHELSGQDQLRDLRIRGGPSGEYRFQADFIFYQVDDFFDWYNSKTIRNLIEQLQSEFSTLYAEMDIHKGIP